MANQPAPKSPGQGNATPNMFQKYFQNYNVGGAYGQPSPTFGTGGIAPAKPGFGTGAPQFGPASGQYAWNAPGRDGGGGGQQVMRGGAPAGGAPAGDTGEYAQIQAPLSAQYVGNEYSGIATEGGAPAGAGQGFATWVESQGNTFYNPYTGELEELQGALAGLLEDDPRALMEEMLAEELGHIKSQEQAALAQQAGIYGAAGLGTSGAFSSDIAGTKTQAGSAAASAQLANQIESEDRYIQWRDRVTDDKLAISILEGTEAGAYGIEKSAIDTYANNAIAQMHMPFADQGWQVNSLYYDDMFSLLTMVKSGNMSLEAAQPLFDSLNQQWNSSGLLFTQGIHGRYKYKGTGDKTSALEVRPGDTWNSVEWDVGTIYDSWERPSTEQFGETINWD